MNQRHDYIEIIQMTKIKLFFRLRVLILRDLVVHVILFILHKIIEQYNLIIFIEEFLSQCINVFVKTLNLLCVHKIQQRMYDITEEKVLRMKNIHSH